MPPERPFKSPVVRVLTPEGTARVLKQHLQRHNTRVLFLAVITLILAAALWLLLYGVACWLILLVFTAGGGSDVEIPRTFLRWFIGFALASMVWVWVCRRLMPNESLRDKKGGLAIVWAFVMAIPQVTFSMFTTLSAWRRLTDVEYEQAAQFIHRLSNERRVPLPSVPQDIPDPRSRDRVLLTLQLMQIIDLQKKDRDWFVTLHVARPKAFQFNRGESDALF